MRLGLYSTMGGVLAAIACLAGCQSNPTHSERGALWGGGIGGVTGALVGGASGNPGAGAAIGAGLGALTGAAIGSDIDADEARNRALIEAQLGRTLAAGSVTMGEVISMVQAKVNDELVINHIRAHGMVAPPTANDLITLQQCGVSPRVVEAMQTSRPPQAQTVVIQESPPPVVVRTYYDPYWPPPRRHYYSHW